jgi:hypothetical protein
VLVLRFSQPLDPARAENMANYILRDHDSRPVTIVEADYLPDSQSVVLRPRRRLNLHFHAALLVIGRAPTGLSNTSGVLLDGANTGQPGSDFSARIARRDLLGPLPPDGVSSQAAGHSPTSDSSGRPLMRNAEAG